MADDEERRREEVHKMHFEFFKHMTTLGTAATVAVLAVYRLSAETLHKTAEAVDWPPWLVAAIPTVPIAGFFLSLFLSLRGMYRVAQARFAEEPIDDIAWMLSWCWRLFFGGVFLIATAAIVITLLRPYADAVHDLFPTLPNWVVALSALSLLFAVAPLLGSLVLVAGMFMTYVGRIMDARLTRTSEAAQDDAPGVVWFYLGCLISTFIALVSTGWILWILWHRISGD